jgi:membrane protein YdbS with pleckstrin-like domain
MKAMSAILPQAQRPFTILGLPAPVAMLTICIGAGVSSVTITLDLVALFLPVALIFVVPLWLFFWRQCRIDHHYDRTLLRTPRFWRGKATRTLIAGRRA